MKKFAIVVLFILALILLAMTVLVHQANAQIEADDPGIPWGDYRITWRSTDQQHYRLIYVNKPGEFCEVEVKADCVDPGKVAPKVGDVCERSGNQKWDCPGDTQELRWTETIIQKCWAFIAKLSKCPPCPVCEAGDLNCQSCNAEETK